MSLLVFPTKYLGLKVLIGRAIAGLAVGMLTMVIPLYISEVCGFSILGLTHALISIQVSLPDIRGGLVVLQQRKSTPPNLRFASSDSHKSLSVEDKLTLSGSFDHYWFLASFWIDYGTHYIGGVRCAPEIPSTGGTSDARTFDPYNDVGPNGCTSQSDASWRTPLALQILPALILGIGMFFYQTTLDGWPCESEMRRLSGPYLSSADCLLITRVWLLRHSISRLRSCW